MCALFPPFWLPPEGFEAKTTPSGPLFEVFWAETPSKCVSGSARTLLLHTFVEPRRARLAGPRQRGIKKKQKREGRSPLS